MNQKNNLLRPVNYEKVKKGSVAGIVACVIWMILGLLFLAVAAFYFIDAKMEEGKSPRNLTHIRDILWRIRGKR